MASRLLYIPVILRTSRKGRMSAHVGRLLAGEVAKQSGVETELIDICSLPLPTDDAGEATIIKIVDSLPGWTAPTA